MPKGTGKKADVIKQGERPVGNTVTEDTLSSVDLGYDYVKTGETPQIGRK